MAAPKKEGESLNGRLAVPGLSPSVAVQPSRAFFVHAQRLVADGAGKKLFRVMLAVAGLIFDLYRVQTE
jgi:hypothetical protein